MTNRTDQAVTKATDFVVQAERRRDEQICRVARLAHSPEALILAERLLDEMERTLQLARLHQHLLEIVHL